MEEGELLHKWLETLIANLEAVVDERTRTEVMDSCGRACARHHGDIEKTETIRHSTQEVSEWLDQLNEQVLWCGSWMRDGDTITSVCEECGCPLVRAGLVQRSPTFCYCSRGWVKAVFETLWGRPVEVELKQAIGRGDQVCEFVVRFDERLG